MFKLNCLVFTLCIVSTLAVKVVLKDEKFTEMQNTCMADHGVTKEQIDENQDSDEVTDKNIACFIKCLYNKIGVMDDEGKLDTDMLLAIIRNEITSSEADKADGAEKELEKCSVLKKDDTCMTAAAQVVCLVGTELFEI